MSIDYTSRDFDGLRQSMLDYAQQVFPDWQPSSEGDFGVLMVELMAYTGDVLSYYVDRAQREAYLPTATQRASVLAIAELLGYEPSNGTPATTTITLQNNVNGPAVTVPAGTVLSTQYVQALDQPIYFETVTTQTIPAATATVTQQSLPFDLIEGQTKYDTVTGGPLAVATATGLPNQTYRLPHPKVYTESVQVFVDGVEWFAIDNLLDTDQSGTRFETTTDAEGYTSIIFGDDLNGAIPDLGLAITAKYRVGVGAAGNVGAGTIVQIVSTIPNCSIKMNTATESSSAAASGGADPETKDQIRDNAPKAFATQQRAVTLTDYENFARATAGVSKAKAVAGSFSAVTVYVVGPDGKTPGQALLDRVSLALNERTLAGVTAQVLSPTFTSLDIGTSGSPVTITVWPTYSRTQTQFAVESVLTQFLSFASRDLGEKLTVGQVYNAIMSVPGVRYIDVPLFARTGSTGNADIQLLPYEFPIPGSIVVTSTGGIG